MDHVAIMCKSWGLLEKIITGEKTAESRWYKTPRPPWNKIKEGDTLWFKNTGEPVTVKARVTKVMQFDNLTPEKTREILEKYGENDLGVNHKYQIPNNKSQTSTKLLSPKHQTEIDDYFKGKRYCVIAFFNQVEKVIPFNIDKTGFGAMSAWICVENIELIRINGTIKP